MNQHTSLDAMQKAAEENFDDIRGVLMVAINADGTRSARVLANGRDMYIKLSHVVSGLNVYTLADLNKEFSLREGG